MNYTIKNENIIASINSFGAQLNSLKKQNDDLEYIWHADEKYWARSSPILFPIVGKLRDNEFIYKNKTYSMNQHGFARDNVFKVIANRDDFVKFKLSSSKNTLEKYPFEFDLYLSYEVKDTRLTVHYEVENRTNDTMYFSIGAHPAFNWPLDNEQKDECYLELNINGTNRYFLEDGLLSNSTFMNCEKIYLSEELFLDDALVFNDEISEVIYKNSKNDKFVKMNFNDFSHLGIWSKPNAPFLCIEPWHGVADTTCHNKHLQDKLGILSLGAKETFRSSYSIEI